MSAPRKLAAILAADVAGYSRLTRIDQEGTLKRLRELRRDRAGFAAMRMGDKDERATRGSGPIARIAHCIVGRNVS